MNTRACIACEIVTGTRVPAGGTIVETAHFNAHQDIAYPVPGFIVVAAKRHFVTVDEMTPDEAADLLPLVIRIRAAQREILGVERTYYFYNEDTRHHFHLWVVPRYAWMEKFGTSIESVRPALHHARDAMSSEGELEELARTCDRLRQHLRRGSRDEVILERETGSRVGS